MGHDLGCKDLNDALGADSEVFLAQMLVEVQAGGPFPGLTGDTKTADASIDGRLGRPRVVPVDAGGGKVLDDVDVDVGIHISSPKKSWWMWMLRCLRRFVRQCCPAAQNSTVVPSAVGRF